MVTITHPVNDISDDYIAFVLDINKHLYPDDGINFQVFDNKKIKNGPSKIFKKLGNGQFFLIEEANYNDDKLDGIKTSWVVFEDRQSVNSKITRIDRTESSYQSGLLSGPTIRFVGNTDDISLITDYKDGLKNGLEVYYKDGRMVFDHHYKQGKRAGIWKEYHETSGFLKTQREYKDDHQCGIETRYKEDGNKWLEIGYEKSRRHGLQIWYSPDGHVTKGEVWDSGERDSAGTQKLHEHIRNVKFNASSKDITKAKQVEEIEKQVKAYTPQALAIK